MFDFLREMIWIIASGMIFLCGIYFSFKLNFIHLNFSKMIKAIKEKPDNKVSISSFQSLAMSLAGRIGVGSLSGIALAVYLGGPGVIFWIWLTSILCATTTFAESLLAGVYRKKNGNVYEGGPFYYIKEGLKNHPLAFIYAFIILVSFISGFLSIQVNTISKCVNEIIHIQPIIIGFIIAILAGITIFGGVKRIADTTGKLVPIMTLFYVSVCLFIIIVNINFIPGVFVTIINNALNFKSFGFGILATLLIGMQKGIFSSEVGLGTGSIAGATADTKSPVNTGLVQTFGIHIENLLLATLTVFVICLSNYQNIVIRDANGIELTLFAFKYHLGNFGPLFIVITIILFGLSTVLTGYYYGETSLKFIKKTNKFDLFIFKIITLIVIIIASFISSNLIWMIVDVMVGFIAIINIYALWKLRESVIATYYKEIN